eukprot:COSAG02_NODE_7793_length_2843_cov_1.282799_3_plen_154_part_00
MRSFSDPTLRVAAAEVRDTQARLNEVGKFQTAFGAHLGHCGDMSHLGRTSDWYVLSQDLHNESHLDRSDDGVTIAMFVELLPGTAKKWAFVFPNLGENGTIVHLHSGMVLVWDGRVVRHCTAMAADGPGRGNHLYGFATLARDWTRQRSQSIK